MKHRAGVPPDAAAADAERALVERLKAGDVAALEPLFERYADGLLRRVIRPRLPDDAAAQDVLKETFVTAMTRIETFEWRAGGVAPWLRQIAVHKVTDHWRARQREERLSGAYQRYLEREVEPARDAEAALGDAEEQERLRARIEATLGELNPRYAQVIRLRLVDERPRADCAEELGVTVGTLDVLFFRALKAFRKRWQGEGGGGNDDAGE